ncbi:hypothetical protein JCM10908_001478 [Rhodotorula pacifica]|uniref:HMG-box domain-containing protein n=1 Tax=Rhodotorula pacifica TaxID=1495444 RepID=UPI00317EC43E
MADHHHQQHYPLSPPSSTSLPEHWGFGTAPPATDGPNTRARLAAGLKPLSGTAAPLPAGGGGGGARATKDGSGYTGSEPLDAWRGHAQEARYWYSSTTTSAPSHSYYAIDPSLEHAASCSFQHQNLDRQQQPPRNFSTATFIDHGSPPASPPSPLSIQQQPSRISETVVYAAGAGQGVGTLGLTKEEWLRLDEADYREETLKLPSPPPFLPPPPPTPAAPTRAVFHLPPQHPLSRPVQTLAAPRPLPPAAQFGDLTQYEEEGGGGGGAPASAAIGRTPTRSQRRRAPSPIQASRARPAPYPTSSLSRTGPAAADIAVASAEEGDEQQPSTDAVEPPQLTPVRAALAKYSEIPLPAVPPSPVAPPDGKKKKRHGRKMSADHIPRPRNAFILFRSHAITSGLIPRSIGVKDHKNISQIVGGVWRGLSEVERQQWEDLAEEEKRRHLAKYPGYAYKPKQKDTPRAAPGQGKKARAKAARMAADFAAMTGADPQKAERYFLAQAHARSGTCSSTSTTSGDDAPTRAGAQPLSATAAEQDQIQRIRMREDRRMALIAQALLEGEQDDQVLLRVEQQLEAELGPAPSPPPPPTGTKPEEDISVVEEASRSSAAKRQRTAPITPRKTRSSAQAAPVVGSLDKEDDITPTKQQQRRSMYASPAASSDSTLSPSPFRRSVMGHHPRGVSPSSSGSPSPIRMQNPHGVGSVAMTRAGGGSSNGKHPLWRSRSAAAATDEEDHLADDLPAARRQKTNSYAALGVASSHDTPHHHLLTPAPSALLSGPSPSATLPSPSYAFPTPTPDGGADVPLFAGPTASRNFSLGRWELRKPSAAVMSRREMLAQQVEEQEDAHIGGAGEQYGEEEWPSHDRREGGISSSSSSSFLLNPTDFLIDAGLETPAVVDPRATTLQQHPVHGAASSAPYADYDDASTEYGTAYSSSVFDAWQSDAASSVYYDTAPSSASARSSAGRMTMPTNSTFPFSTTGKHAQGLFRQPSSAASVAAGPSLFAAQQQQQQESRYATPSQPNSAGLCEPPSATATAGASPEDGVEEEDLFHFGVEDLFAQPPPALSLFGDPDARTVSSIFGSTNMTNSQADGSGAGDPGPFGLGIALP